MTDHPLAPDEDEQLLEVAVEIADGAAPDWTASAVGAHPKLAAGLRSVERVVRAHEVLCADHDASGRPYETLITEARRRDPRSGDLGVRWGPLLVLNKIASGAFGDVYRAWDRRLEREVALKLMPDRSSDGTSAVEEGRLLARVRHPNVLTVFGAERIDGRVGIWTEHLPGRTLADEVADGGALPPEDVARVGIEVCNALAAVHAKGLLHRDVKAQNVMRDASGRVVLADFGTGIEHQDNVAIGESGIAGTPLYLAPELYAGHPASVASDIYSVGVLLYFLATADFPVSGRSFSEIKQAHADGARKPIRKACPSIPEPLALLLESLLAPAQQRAEMRPASVAAALNTWLHENQSADGRGKKKTVAAGMLVAAAAAVALLALSPYLADRLGGPRDSISRKLTDAPCSAAPDARGRAIACVAASFPPALMVFDPATGQSRKVGRAKFTETFLRISSVSPDGQHVIVQALGSGRDRLRLINIVTGAVTEIGTVPTELSELTLGKWSAVDDRVECRIRRRDGSQALALLARTGSLEIVFEFPGIPHGFSRSRDGRFIAFDILADKLRGQRDLRVCEIRSKECIPVAEHPGNDFFPQWDPEGNLLFNSDRTGTYGLWKSTVRQLRVTAPPTLVRDTGRQFMIVHGFTEAGDMYYDLQSAPHDIYASEIDDKTQAAPPVRLSPRAIDSAKGAVWSPDGQSLAYIARRGPFAERGAMRIVVQDTGTGAEREFQYDMQPGLNWIPGTVDMNRLAWSPDGRVIALRSSLVEGSRTSFGIHLFDAASGRLMRTLVRKKPAESSVFAQVIDIGWLDTRTIAFSSAAGVGTFDTASGVELRLWAPPAGTRLHWMSISPDRRELAIATTNSPLTWITIAILPRGDGTLRTLLKRTREQGLMVCHDWKADGTALWCTEQTRPESSVPLWRLPVDGSAPVAQGLLGPGALELRAHPDGRRLTFTLLGGRAQFWMTTAGARQPG